jgi:hypothetical protein
MRNQKKRKKQLNNAQLRKFRFYLQEYITACEYVKEDVRYSLNDLGSKGCKSRLKRVFDTQQRKIKSCEVLLNSIASTLYLSDNIIIPTP